MFDQQKRLIKTSRFKHAYKDSLGFLHFYPYHKFSCRLPKTEKTSESHALGRGSPASTRSRSAQGGTQHAELHDAPPGHPPGHRTAVGPGTWQQPLPPPPPPSPVPARPCPRGPERRQPPGPARGRSPHDPRLRPRAATRGDRVRFRGLSGRGSPAGPRPRARPQTAHPRAAEPRGPLSLTRFGGRRAARASGCRRREARCLPRPEAAHGARRLRRRLPLGGSQVRAAPPSASPGGQVCEAAAGSARILPSAASARRARRSVTPAHSEVPAARGNGRIAVEARRSGTVSFRQSPPCYTARGRALPAHVAGRRHKTPELRSELERRDGPLRAWTEGTALLAESRRIVKKRKGCTS